MMIKQIEPCYHGSISETKRLNHEYLTIEEIKCSRCSRYGCPSQGCVSYTTREHIERFYDLMIDDRVRIG